MLIAGKKTLTADYLVFFEAVSLFEIDAFSVLRMISLNRSCSLTQLLFISDSFHFFLIPGCSFRVLLYAVKRVLLGKMYEIQQVQFAVCIQGAEFIRRLQNNPRGISKAEKGVRSPERDLGAGCARASRTG